MLVPTAVATAQEGGDAPEPSIVESQPQDDSGVAQEDAGVLPATPGEEGERSNADEVASGMPARLMMAVVLGLAFAIFAGLWVRDFIRPTSFQRTPPRSLADIGAELWAGSAIVAFMAGALGAGLALGVLQPEQGRDLEVRELAIVSMSQFGMGICVALGAVYFLRHLGQRDGLRVRALDAPLGLLGFGLAYPIVLGTSMLAMSLHLMITGEESPSVAHNLLVRIVEQREGIWVFVLSATVVIGAPIAEELVYRVLLQGALLRLSGSAWVSIIATSLLFALVHLGSVPWYALLPLFVLGLALGVAYERTKRLGVPIVMHAAFNLLNILIARAG